MNTKEYFIQSHANGVHTFILNHIFRFEFGGEIDQLTLAYETYGTLSPQKDNVILIHHALSTNSHVASHTKNPAPGWWESMIGPGRPIDTNKFFVICINNLGSCFGSSGPASSDPRTKKPYRNTFPIVTMRDIVKAQYLLTSYLGIEHLYAIIGNSMGGMLSLTWAIDWPDSVARLISISSCYKAYPANIANRAIQREIIQLDPAFKKGRYEKNPSLGLKIARKLGHFTYRNAETLNQKFLDDSKCDPDKPAEIENYLEYNANKFVSYFDANSYLYLLQAMDLFDATRPYGDVQSAFSRIQASALVVSVDSDILFTPKQQEDLYAALKLSDVTTDFIQHHSSYGHDTFLVETDRIGKYIQNFLESLP